MIELEGRSVCINCKPKVVQRIREGLPVSGIAAASTQFLYISAPRLVLTSIGSLGIFEAYWIYKNWRYYKEKHDMAMRPFGQILCLSIGLIIWALAGLGLDFEMLLA